MSTTDLRSHLETEARLIAEDDGHVVMAFKIPKSWLARNFRFITAIADCAMPMRRMRARKRLKGSAR